MEPLILIGYWHDGSPQSVCVHPHYLVDDNWDTAERELVANYLRSGKRCNAYLGYSSCRFNCGISCTEMGTCEQHDGKFIWPEGLVHYIEAHNVKLPEMFLEHMRKNKTIRIEEDKDWAMKYTPMNLNYWMKFCTSYPKDFPKQYEKQYHVDDWTPAKGLKKREEFLKNHPV